MAKNDIFYRPEWTKEGPGKNGFWVFSNSEINVREKVDQRMGSLVFMFPYLHCLRKNIFLQFCAGLSKKSAKAIYLDVSERCFTLSENGTVYYAICYGLLF